MEIDVREQNPGSVTAIRWSDTCALYGSAASQTMELRVDGQPAGSGVYVSKDNADALIRALNAAKKVW